MPSVRVKRDAENHRRVGLNRLCTLGRHIDDQNRPIFAGRRQFRSVAAERHTVDSLLRSLKHSRFEPAPTLKITPFPAAQVFGATTEQFSGSSKIVECQFMMREGNTIEIEVFLGFQGLRSKLEDGDRPSRGDRHKQ